MKLADALELKVRNEDCTACKQHVGADKVCVAGRGSRRTGIMVVGGRPNSQAYQEGLDEFLTEAGLDPSNLFFTSSLRCRNFDAGVSNLDVKACRQYLDAEIALVKPKWILALGNEALFSLTGHSGIMKYRGRVIDKGEYSVFPTISPAAVQRNPGQRHAFMADLHLFVATVMEKAAKVPPPDIQYIMDKEMLRKFKGALAAAELISYDVETTGDGEFAEDAAIVSLSATLVTGDGQLSVWALPLFHPQSPFRNVWKWVLEMLAPLLSSRKKNVAHNGKYDARWLRHFGVPKMRVTFDTIIAASLLDENRQKGLKPQAGSRLGVAPWAIETRNLLSTPIMEVLEYNALDTYYTYHIYLDLKKELAENPRLLRIFLTLMMPATEKYIEAERRGIWVDREVLATSTKITNDMLQVQFDKLMEWVPNKEKWVAKGKWPTSNAKRPKPLEVNFRPSNFARWLLFDRLGLPVIKRGKQKPNGDPGDPSMAEDVLLELKKFHPIAEVMLERARWQQMTQFCEAYDKMADENDRIHTTFKLWGTVTGRTSSGKEDAEKLTGMRDTRGVNIQQVPRDPTIRGIFGAPPGWVWIEADYSQVELRIAAFIAREQTMLHLYRTGQDIHRATAAWVLGIPPDKITKEERKKAKAVNFGFLYGMGAKKFVETAFLKYEAIFTLEEAQAIRKQFFTQFPGLTAWHNRQRRLVHEYARVQSPIGRVRHLPDIRSEDDYVRGEAERQAINSPVQSFASDMLLLGMVLIDDEFHRLGLDDTAHIVGTVHDAALFEVREDKVRKVLPLIKGTMENLPLKKKFGVDLDLPIVADLKVGRHWGDARELTEQEVFKWKPKYLEVAA